jgi:hypothetical protein
MRHRIWIAVLCVGALSAGARAAGGDDASRQLQNLVYYPHAGEFRATGQFTGSLQDSGQTDNDLGVQTASRSTSYERATATLAAGLFGGLRIAASETELFQQKIQSTNLMSGVVTNSNSEGFSDPTVTLSERFRDSRDEGFFLDGSVNATPHLGRALAAGNGQTGNDLSSGWTAGASLTGYYRWYTGFDREFPNEFSVSPSATRFFGGVASGASLPSSTLTSSYWSGSVAIEDRLHFNRHWYVQPGVTLYMPYTYETANQTPGAMDTSHTTQFYAAPSATIGFLPSDWILIDAMIAYSNNTSNAYPATGSSTSAQTAQTYAALQVQVAF